MPAIERALSLRGTGQYSDRHRLLGLLSAYGHRRKEMMTKRRYDDVAYIDGYAQGLLFMITRDDETAGLPPLFYGFGHDEIWDQDAYAAIVDELPARHKQAMKRARKIAADVERRGGDLEMHHRPQL